MPVSINPLGAANDVYGSPFIGPIDHTAQIAINVTALTVAEVDSQGFIKPGLPFSAAGALVGAATPVFGVTIEPIKVATGNGAAALAAADASFQIALATIGQVNRAVIEANLGRALTANEIAGFALAPCLIKLL